MRAGPAVLVAIAAASATGSTAMGRPSVEESAFDRIIEQQIARYPRMELQDLYKLAFQAAMGSAHSVRDAAEAREWLAREARDLAPGPAEPVVDPISPDGDMVRVNLRPYLAAGGELAALAEAFVRTAHTYRASLPRLEEYLAYVERLTEAGRLPVSAAGLRAYCDEMRKRGYPVPEHSARYVEAYHPAYRVLLRAYLTAP